MDKKEIVDFFRGFGDLIEKGEIRLGDISLPFPESAEIEVEYKEKKDRAKLEVEVKWKPQKKGHSKYEVESLNVLRDYKKSLKKVFNSMRDTVKGGGIPSTGEVATFLELNKAFNDLAIGRDYAKDMAAYMGLVNRFEVAAKSGSVEDLKLIVKELRASKKSCHKTYRWKDE